MIMIARKQALSLLAAQNGAEQASAISGSPTEPMLLCEAHPLN